MQLIYLTLFHSKKSKKTFKNLLAIKIDLSFNGASYLRSIEKNHHVTFSWRIKSTLLSCHDAENFPLQQHTHLFQLSNRLVYLRCNRSFYSLNDSKIKRALGWKTFQLEAFPTFALSHSYTSTPFHIDKESLFYCSMLEHWLFLFIASSGKTIKFLIKFYFRFLKLMSLEIISKKVKRKTMKRK